MPWLSLIMWLVSFLVAKSKGASTSKAALLATGVGLATYYVADPANPDNLLGLSFGDESASGGKAIPGDPTADSGKTGSEGFGSKALSEVGSTLRSWGPLGTLGVVAGTTGAATGNNTWLWIGGAALLAVLLLK